MDCQLGFEYNLSLAEAKNKGSQEAKKQRCGGRFGPALQALLNEHLEDPDLQEMAVDLPEGFITNVFDLNHLSNLKYDNDLTFQQARLRLQKALGHRSKRKKERKRGSVRDCGFIATDGSAWRDDIVMHNGVETKQSSSRLMQAMTQGTKRAATQATTTAARRSPATAGKVASDDTSVASESPMTEMEEGSCQSDLEAAESEGESVVDSGERYEPSTEEIMKVLSGDGFIHHMEDLMGSRMVDETFLLDKRKQLVLSAIERRCRSIEELEEIKRSPELTRACFDLNAEDGDPSPSAFGLMGVTSKEMEMCCNLRARAHLAHE